MDNSITPQQPVKPKQPDIIPVEHENSVPAEENLGEVQAFNPQKPETQPPVKKPGDSEEEESHERANELYEEELPPETRIH